MNKEIFKANLLKACDNAGMTWDTLMALLAIQGNAQRNLTRETFTKLFEEDIQAIAKYVHESPEYLLGKGATLRPVPSISSIEIFEKMVGEVFSHVQDFRSDEFFKLLTVMFNNLKQEPANFCEEAFLLVVYKMWNTPIGAGLTRWNLPYNADLPIWDTDGVEVFTPMGNRLIDYYDELCENISEHVDFEDLELNRKLVEARKFVMNTPEYSWALRIYEVLHASVANKIINMAEPTHCFW